DLLARYRTAAARHERSQVLTRFDIGGLTLNEATATELYDADPVAARGFILTHLPSPWGWGQNPPRWSDLWNRALQRGCEDFAFAIYRRQVSSAGWQADALKLAAEIADPAELLAALERRHPEVAAGSGPLFLELLHRRGRDVLPYVLRHLHGVRS